MAMRNKDADQIETRWFIDLGWYQQNNRSFSILAQRCLCSKCRKQLEVEKAEFPVDELLANIKDCCSQETDYITDALPVLESVFRLFLANGNQPLGLEELSRQLSDWRGGGSYRTSVETLSRLLENDQYYGLSQVVG
jgi:hypothetical protein